MASITDKYTLTVESFEGAIAVGRTRAQIMAQFDKTSEQMNEFCKENYEGRDFKLVYEWVRQCTVDEYLHCVRTLGLAGNPSALGIIDKAIQKDESASAVKIEFVATLPQEGGKDKEDDG